MRLVLAIGPFTDESIALERRDFNRFHHISWTFFWIGGIRKVLGGWFYGKVVFNSLTLRELV